MQKNDYSQKLRIQLSKEHETELKERGLLQHHKIAALAKVQVEKEKTKQQNANKSNIDFLVVVEVVYPFRIF